MESDKNTHDGLVDVLNDDMKTKDMTKESVENFEKEKQEEELKHEDSHSNQHLDGISLPDQIQEGENLEVEVAIANSRKSVEDKQEKEESLDGDDNVVELEKDVQEEQLVEEDGQDQEEEEVHNLTSDEKENENENEKQAKTKRFQDVDGENDKEMNSEHNETEGITEKVTAEEQNENQIHYKYRDDVEIRSEAKARTELDENEDDDEIIKIYNENDQRDALDDEVEENSQDIELDHDIEFIDGSQEGGDTSPPSFRNNNLRFHKSKRATERSELPCIPELTQESVLRNSTVMSSDEKRDMLNSITVTKSQMTEFKTAKELEGTAERLKTQENQFLTENDENEKQPQGLTESKSSNIEILNIHKNKDLLLLTVPKMPRAKSQEGIKSLKLEEGKQENGEEVLHHIDEASHESKSSFEVEAELPAPKNPDLGFTFGKQQLQADQANTEYDGSHEKSLDRPIIKIHSEQISIDDKGNNHSIQQGDLLKNLSGFSGEYPMSDLVNDLRSATEGMNYSIAESLNGRSNLSSTVAIGKNIQFGLNTDKKQVEQPEQEDDIDRVAEKINPSQGVVRSGLTSKYGEDDYANEEFESLTVTASFLQNKLSDNPIRLSAFQSGQSLINQEYEEVEQNSQNSQNQYALPDPKSIDEYDEEFQAEAEVEVEKIENFEKENQESAKELPIIKKAESFSDKENNEEKESALALASQRVSKTENLVLEKEEEEQEGNSQVKSKTSSRIDLKVVEGESSSKKDLESRKIDLIKQSASPESEPRTSQQSYRGGEPTNSRADELIQKALSEFSEDIPLEIQKGAVPKFKSPLQSGETRNKLDDESLPSVIQRGVVPNFNQPKQEIENYKNEDPMYGLEELSARLVEEVKARTITPNQEIDHLSEEHMTKMTRRVPAPVMKRRSSSQIRAKTKSFVIEAQQEEEKGANDEQKMMPEMHIRFAHTASVKRDAQISAPKSRPSGSKSPQIRQNNVIQKKENGQFVIQNVDVMVPEIYRDDPKKYPIDGSPTRLHQPMSKPSGRPTFRGRKSKSPSLSPDGQMLLSSSVLVEGDQKKRGPISRPSNKPLLVQKNNSDSSVSLNMETEDEKLATFERDHRKRVKGREKHQHQAYYLKRGAQETNRAFHNSHLLEPLNHSRVEYPSRVSDLENEETSIYTTRAYRQARHASISHQRVDELEETIHIPRYSKDYRKAGVPEDVSSQIRKTIAKQKEIVKKADMYNPYNPYWTKKMLNEHFGVDIEPSNDSDHNRWKLRRIKQNRQETQPRDSQQDVPTSQPEEDRVIFSQNLPAWDSSRKRESPNRRPTPIHLQKRSGSNPHRRLSPMPMDPQKREKVDVNNYLIQSSELYKGALAMYSTPKHPHEEAVEEGTVLMSPMAKQKYLQGAKRNSVRRHRPMNEINSARGEVFYG